jgi:hypothetical protein
MLLAACSNRKSNQVLTLTITKEAAKSFIGKNSAIKLAAQKDCGFDWREVGEIAA